MSDAYTPDLTTDGWTTVSDSVDTRNVYVDSVSGSDANDGLSSSTPKETWAAALALLRDGYPDHLWIACGSDFSAEFFPARYGRSSDEPMVVGSYGSGDRPLVGWISQQNGAQIFKYLLFVDIEWGTAANYGLRILGTTDGVTSVRFEGCYIGRCLGSALDAAAGSIDGVTFYRCVVADAHGAGHSIGLYASNVTNLLVDECYFDKNGWDVSSDQDIYQHNIYLQFDCGPATIRKSWFSRASSHGVHHRCAGTNEDNTYYYQPIHLQMGYNDASAPRRSGDIRRNVVVKGRSINGSDRHWGITLDNTDGVSVAYNIVCHMGDPGATYPEAAYILQGNLDGSTNTSLLNNIAYRWATGVSNRNGAGEQGTLTMRGNDIQQQDGGYPVEILVTDDNGSVVSSDNRFYSTESAASRYYNGSAVSFATLTTAIGDTTSTETDLSGTYTDPEKDMDGYAVSIGLADADALLTQIRTQRKGNWDLNLTPDRINAYFRANFDMLPAPQDLTGSVSQETVSLSWDGAPEDDSYVVERSADTSSWSVATSVSSTSATDTPGTGDWYYRVTPVVNSTSGDVSDSFLAEGVMDNTTINIQLSANRLSGVAPFNIHLDMGGTSATGITFPGLDIEYLTDWGDSGSYIPSSHGVVAAHVYETPGEYTVTVSGIIPSSLEITTSSFTVTAIDPDTYYSGTATVCISNDTDFTGSSVDCSTVTLTDISQLASYCGSGIRTLLKRGVTWDLTANTTIPDGSYIGVFGTATGERTGRGCYENDPIIDYGYTSTLFQINDTNGADYTVLKNIHFFNGDVSSGNLVTMTGDSSAKNVLIHQCTFSRYATAAGTSNDLAAFADKVSTPYFCISKSEFYPASFSLSDAEGLEGSTFGIYIGGYGQAVIGNYFPGQESFNDLSGYHSHVFRSIYSHKLAIQKNYFGGIQNSTRHILKLHHVLFGAASSLTNQTDYGGDICITENTYSGINNTWAVVPGPADTRDMRLSGIYIANERAYTASDGGVSQMYAPFARDVRIKNCFLRDYSTGYSHHFVYAGNRGDDPAASGLEVYNCTYRTGAHTSHESSFIEIASTSGYEGSAIVRNCVVDWDSGGDLVPLINPASDSSKLVSSNIHLSSDGDAGFTDSDSGNFTLLSSSPLIGAGISGVSYFDIDGRIRDTNETEIGAYEYFSTEPIVALTINSIVTNKLIGPTPLAVHCDATDISGSSYDDPQRDVVFLWDWGDPTNYNNSSIGCCAACVYENSGTFTVSVTALDLSSGLSDTSSFNISAYSPDEYYAGSSTIVFSPSGDFTDAPTGAIQVTTSSINDIVSYGGEGNRLLLQRGATFYASATPEVIDGTYMDAYQAGTGETSEGAYANDPIIDWEGQSLGLTLLSANGASGTWINHIHTLSGATEFYGGIGIIGGDAHSNNINVTIAHCHVDRCGIGIGVNSDLAVYYGEAPTPYFCVYRNKVTPYYTAVDGATTNHACYASGKGLMLLGNNFYGEISGGPGYTDSHCCRVTYAPKAVIENNQFYPSQNFSRHSLKFHTLDYPTASGLSAVDDVARDICITKNSFIAANIWILAVGPQDSINDERIDGVYFAQNTISAVNYMNAAHYIAARNVKIESTTVISETIGWDTHFARCEKRGLELDPSGLRIYNSVLYYNTDYNEGEAGFVRLLADYSGSATVKNCVAATTGGTETFPIVPVVGSLTTVIQESNIESDTAPGFIEASAGNFGLLSSSTLIDTGVDVPVYQDLSGSTWTGTYEIGAVQYTSPEPVTEHNATATITLPSLGITASAEVSSSPGQTTISATADITLPSLGVSISANNQVLPGIPSSINVYLETPNINIEWGAATSAVSYTVEMDLASSGYSELSSGITSPLSATVAYPGVGTQRFRVYATNPNGDGGTIQGFLYTAPVTPTFTGTGRGFLGKSLLELKLSL